ncbi:MAG: hypothetical protein ACR2P4_04060 [Gammaproteobacteria bacterium]
MDAEVMEVLDILVLAVTLAVCAIFWHWTAKREKGMPPPVSQLDCYGWNPGMILAPARDWWRWQFYVYLASLVMGAGWIVYIVADTDNADIITSAFVAGEIGIGLFGLTVFLYFGAQRFIAAGKSPLWIFAMMGIAFFSAKGFEAIFASDAAYILSEMVFIAILIYIGTLRDKEPRAELTGGDNAAAA